MAGPGAGIEDVPSHMPAVVHVSSDHCRNGIEVTGVQKFRTTAKLRQAVAARCRATAPTR
jgi:hypothetical protein